MQKQQRKLDVSEKPLAEIEPLRFAELVQSSVLNHMQFLANVAGASLSVSFPHPKEGDVGVVAIQLAQYAKDGAIAGTSPPELVRILATALYSFAGKPPVDERDMDRAVALARTDEKVWTTVVEASLARWHISRGEETTCRQLAALLSTSVETVVSFCTTGQISAAPSGDGDFVISADEALKFVVARRVKGFDGQPRKASTAADLANDVSR